MTAAASAWPQRIEVRRGDRVVRCLYDDGVVHHIAFCDLRAMTPSAEGRGHGGDLTSPLPGDYSQVDVTGAEAVGAYAVRFTFSDGHATGLYTWDRLRMIGDRSHKGV